ncbi:MAG: DNA/RNA non-specific endonuclease [Treponema sp.]|nr:DNA/RNA non-specific endonuclease [Treponema sp.]
MATKKTDNTKASVKKTTSSKSTKSKGTKKSKKGAKLTSILTTIVLILGLVWFFGGKPIVELGGAEGVTIILTEDPIIYHIPEYLAGTYPPETNYAEINGTETNGAPSQSLPPQTAQTTTETAPVESAPTTTKTAKSTGTKGSDPKADQGHAEDNPLHFGNPSDAYSDTTKNTNYLMTKPQYTLSYNTKTLCPNWVAWHLDTGNIGDADRCDDFRPDEELPDGWYGVKKADYQYNKYGFDRGHVCPSADRTTTKDDNSMTFLMTNMVPQSPDNNRVIWMHFENYERELARAGNELYIIAGPYGTGGTSSKGTFNEIPITLKSGETLNMNVPASTWKVVLVLPVGSNDLSRVTADTTVIAINVPNEMGMGKTGDWEQFITTIDEIEALTGYDFFELLPDSIENKLEAKRYEYSK